MSPPIMPKATAIWLLENTTLTFEQIADYCALHTLEIQALADGEIGQGLAPFDPIAHGQLSQEEIDRVGNDPAARLVPLASQDPVTSKRRGGGRYTPVSRRQDKPDAIAWVLKHHPELSDRQICQLLGTTSPTIRSIREKTHHNTQNIKARSPVGLNLCTEQELQKAIEESKKGK